MLSSDFLFPRFFVVPLANPSNFSHCKCFSSRSIYNVDCYSCSRINEVQVYIYIVALFHRLLVMFSWIEMPSFAYVRDIFSQVDIILSAISLFSWY